MKRVLIIAGVFIGAVIIVTLGILLRSSSTPPTGPAGSLPPGGTLPIAGTGEPGVGSSGGIGGVGIAPGEPGSGGLPTAGVSAVAQAAVLDYVITSQGITFIASNGAIISPSSSEAIGQANFGDIMGAWFSPDGKWLLVESGSNDFSRWSLLDVAKKTWRDIQANTSEMFWSPNSSQLAYFARRTGGTTLSVYAPATNATRALMSFAAPDLTLRWRDNSHIFIMDHPSSLVSGSIWDVATSGGTLTQLATNVPGVDVLWGGPVNGGMLFKAGPTGGTVSIVTESGATTQVANFLTFPSKCFFGERTPTSTIEDIDNYLFCAIPQNQELMKERQLPDDYLKGKFGTTDTLYAIGLLSGTLTPVLPASQGFSFDAANLKVYGDSLYFVNRNDRKLYKVSLSALAGPGDTD